MWSLTVIDRAFVLVDATGSGTAVLAASEPSICVLFFGGLAIVVGTVRRRRGDRASPDTRAPA